MAHMAGEIAHVAPRSLAARAGLQPGDVLLAVNDHPLRDVIDVQFYTADERLTFRVRRGAAEFSRTVQRRYNEPLGLEFTHPLFDSQIRHCNNRCDFCFVAQMPPGLRPSLYVKDDDYRYSFLSGSYITLTNLNEEDWARIAEQRLSPLYVSVHATEPELRQRLLHHPGAPDILAQLRRLAQIGIETHAQVVLVPGLNDGPYLDRTIGDLADLYPAVASLSVVPVGLTRFHRGGCRPVTMETARAVYEQVTGWQARLLPRLGRRFVYLSDEWYLRLGKPVPPQSAYDGLDLTENGVGLVRRFLGCRFQVPSSPANNLKPETTLATGTLFAPVLRQATAHLPGVEVVAVVNRFFGETVTVAGLLTAQDVIEGLRERTLGERVILPGVMFGGPEGESLDGRRPEEIAAMLDRPVTIWEWDEDVGKAPRRRRAQ